MEDIPPTHRNLPTTQAITRAKRTFTVTYSEVGKFGNEDLPRLKFNVKNLTVKKLVTSHHPTEMGI